MSKYEADVWLSSEAGRQKIYVDSNTWNGARDQIKKIYQVQDSDIWDLTESRTYLRSDYYSSNYYYNFSNFKLKDYRNLILAIIAFCVFANLFPYSLIFCLISLFIWKYMRWRNQNN